VTYSVLARYHARPAAGEQVAELLLKHISATRAEPGNLGFTVLRDPENPGNFVLFEQYVDEAAFRAHADSPHYQEFVAEGIRPLLDDRSVEFLDEFSPVPRP